MLPWKRCICLALAFTVVALFTPPCTLSAHAANSDDAKAISKEQTAELSELLNAVEGLEANIARLNARIEGVDGMSRDVLERLRGNLQIEQLEQGLIFVSSVMELTEEDKTGLDRLQQQTREVLSTHPGLVENIIGHTFRHVDMPDPGLSIAEQAAAFNKTILNIGKINKVLGLFRQSNGISLQLGFDTRDDIERAKKWLVDLSTFLALLLELSLDEADGVRAGVAVLPEDTELAAKLNLTEKRINSLADELAISAAMMDELELDTVALNRLIVSSTGQISTETFERDVLAELFVDWGNKFYTLIIDDGPNLLLNTLLFVFIVLVFRKLSLLGSRLVTATFDRAQADVSKLLRDMAIKLTRHAVLVFGILIALSQIGISLGPLLAGLGVAGFIIGFALQDSLANLASGMMILIYRPFDVGDLIEAGGVFGTVSHMSLVSTNIYTLDNQTIMVPNNKIWGDVIKNVTAQKERRVDLIFGISYGDDIQKAERVLEDVLQQEPRVLDEPEAVVRVHELGDNSVNFAVRPWVKTLDYWEAYWAITRAVKMRFDEEGISIPFPQRDTHLDASEPLRVKIETTAP